MSMGRSNKSGKSGADFNDSGIFTQAPICVHASNFTERFVESGQHAAHVSFSMRPHDIKLAAEEESAPEHAADAQGLRGCRKISELKHEGWRAGHAADLEGKRGMTAGNFTEA